MIFDLTKWLLNPFVLMFLAVVSGLAFGKIKFGKFNFGVSGTLFTGLIVGWGIVKYAKSFIKGDSYYPVAQKFMQTGVIDKVFFSLFLIIFVAAVGLLAAKDIKVVLKKYGLKFIALGLIITFVGAGATYGMTLLSSSLFNVDANPYEISGVYTGALTSSPGLAAAIETARGHATGVGNDYEKLDDAGKEQVLKMLDIELSPDEIPILEQHHKTTFIGRAEGGIGIGHAIGYPFGVIVVIFAVNFFPKIFKMNVKEEERIFREEMNSANIATGSKPVEETHFDLIAFCVAMLLGYTLGKISLDLDFIGMGSFSLGSTGGVLLMALTLGYFGKIGPLNFRMNTKVLGVLRQFALAFFSCYCRIKVRFPGF